MKILRRLTAAMLVLVMVVTMLPVSALADEAVGDGVLDVPETVETESAEIVETVVPDGPEAAETEAVETVAETTASTEAVETVPETTACEETWEIPEVITGETEKEVNTAPKRNASRLLTEIRVYDELRNISEKHVYNYNEQNYLTSIVSNYYGSYPYENITSFTYDSEGRLCSFERSFSNLYCGFIYNDAGQLDSVSYAGLGWYTENFEYDALGNCIRKTVEDDNNYSYSPITEYNYNEENQLISTEETCFDQWSGESWINRKVFDYLYPPFVVVNEESHGYTSCCIELQINNGISFDSHRFSNPHPEFYNDEEGYLAKVIDTNESAGNIKTTTYEFYYDGELAQPIEDDELIGNDNKVKDAYNIILEEYRQVCSMSSSEFNEQYDGMSPLPNFPNVNFQMMFYYHLFGRMEIVYTYYDIDGNGYNELLLGSKTDNGISIIDLYAFDGEKAVKLLDTWSLGIRAHLVIYMDGTLCHYGSSGAADSNSEYYRIDKSGCKLEAIKLQEKEMLSIENLNWIPLDVSHLGLHFVLSPDIENLTVKTGQTLEITVHLYDGDELVTDLAQPDLALGHLGNEKVVNYIGWEPTGDGGYILKLKGAAPGTANMTIYDETTDTKLEFSIPVIKAEVNAYLDNSEIKINSAGSAFAYFIGDPNQDFLLTVNEKALSVRSNENGVFRVPLGTFAADGKENVTVNVTHIGGNELPEPLVFHSCITVTPLEFSQSWEASFDPSVSLGLNLGAEIKPFNLEGSLASAEAEIGGGTAMSITRSYTAEGETLEITSDKKVEVGATVKCGITGTALTAEFESGVFGKVGHCDTVTYGIRFENYSAENSAQQRALATYLLGEARFARPNNLFYNSFYERMADTVYKNASCILINGSASKTSGSFGGGFGEATINGVKIGSILETEVGASIEQEKQVQSSGDLEKSMSAKLDMNLSAIGGDKYYNGAALSADFLGRDIKITAKQTDKKKTLEATSLSSESVEMKIFQIGVPSTAAFNKYTFEAASMNELLSKTSSFESYLNGDGLVLSLYDMCQLANAISTCDEPIKYESETKEKYVFSLPLEFGVSLGVEVGLGVDLSYLEDTSYTNATGYAVEDNILLTSESVDLSSQVKANKRNLSEVFTNCIKSLANDAANFFKKIGDSIQQGVEDAWGWIEEKTDSVKDWFVSLTCVSTEEAWGESTEIGVLGSYVNFSLARQSVKPNEAYVTRSAMTIGRPFVVNVTDNATGEEITNFEEEPLEFTLRYAGEDLLASNYDAQTQVISMYRYSDDGDYFEYIGGIHDAEAKTVTATITKPGQYILAAEVIQEEGCGYDLGDVNHDTKINAKDATLILQKSVGVLKETAKFCEDCAEVSGDGKLNAKDSTLILQFSVGLRDGFPAGA